MTSKRRVGHCNICGINVGNMGTMTEDERIAYMDDHSENKHKKQFWSPVAVPVDGKDPKTWKGDGTQRDWYILERGF